MMVTAQIRPASHHPSPIHTPPKTNHKMLPTVLISFLPFAINLPLVTVGVADQMHEATSKKGRQRRPFYK